MRNVRTNRSRHLNPKLGGWLRQHSHVSLSAGRDAATMTMNHDGLRGLPCL